MFAWKQMQGWQRALAMAAVAFFSFTFYSTRTAAELPSPNWAGLLGAFAIVFGAFLNPGSFGVRLAAADSGGWQSKICKLFSVGGAIVVVLSFAVRWLLP
jgi:hypothetical protein